MVKRFGKSCCLCLILSYFVQSDKLQAATVIRNGKFSAITLWDDRRVIYVTAVQYWTYYTSKATKNWKRPMKVRKAKSKARHEEISFFHIFSAWMCSLEGFRLVFLLVWNFKVKKAKKAATKAQTWNSKMCNFFVANLVNPHYL